MGHALHLCPFAKDYVWAFCEFCSCEFNVVNANFILLSKNLFLGFFNSLF